MYETTGRRWGWWRRLVQNAVPHFVEPVTGGPLAGREESWSLVNDYRVRLALGERKWAEAERMQYLAVDWHRQRTQSALQSAPQTWNSRQRNDIRSLGVAFHGLAEIQREQGKTTCVDAYRESLAIDKALGDSAGQAVTSFNLGNAHMSTPDLRDLDKAERWYRQSLGLRKSADALGRARCLGSLGLVAFERFIEARSAAHPVQELARHLAEASELYEQALKAIPAAAFIDRAITHNQLGIIYRYSGDTDRALHHYRHCIRYRDETGDIFNAGQSRYNVALALLGSGRLRDAKSYAEAALANFQEFGDRAAADTQETERLIAQIEEVMAQKGNRT